MISARRLRNDAYEASGQLRFGRYSYGTPIIHAYGAPSAHARIGAFVSIAAGVELFLGGEHRTDWVTASPLRAHLGLPNPDLPPNLATKGNIEIGNDVWLGAGAKVLSGVSIANGAVVGAHAVVSTNVRPYAVVVGNPAREVRRRFTDEQIKSLEAIAWWTWPDAVIRQRVDDLCSPRIDDFISQFGRGTSAIG